MNIVKRVLRSRFAYDIKTYGIGAIFTIGFIAFLPFMIKELWNGFWVLMDLIGGFILG